MARTKTNTQNNTKTHRTPLRNIHSEKNLLFVLFGFFYIYNYWNDFFKKVWVTALVRSMTSVGSLNQFFAIIANLTLSQHLLEKKMIITYIYSLSTQAIMNMNQVLGLLNTGTFVRRLIRMEKLCINKYKHLNKHTIESLWGYGRNRTEYRRFSYDFVRYAIVILSWIHAVRHTYADRVYLLM